MLAKIYSNSLLVMFNAQIRIVGARHWEPDGGSGAGQSVASQSTALGGAGEDVKAREGRDRPLRIALNGAGIQMPILDRHDDGLGWDGLVELQRKVRSWLITRTVLCI